MSFFTSRPVNVLELLHDLEAVTDQMRHDNTRRDAYRLGDLVELIPYLLRHPERASDDAHATAEGGRTAGAGAGASADPAGTTASTGAPETAGLSAGAGFASGTGSFGSSFRSSTSMAWCTAT